jgi:hypothetical protein
MLSNQWTISITPAFQGLGTWIKGVMDFDVDMKLTFCIKVFDEPSAYGINGNGRISKLEIRLDGETLACYERGWCVELTEEVMPIYQEILDTYN